MMKETSQRIFLIKYVKKMMPGFMLGAILLLAMGSALHARGAFDMPDGTQRIVTAPEVMQQPAVTGRVTDASGNPMPGVNIVEKGTLNGTITDANGMYSITVASPSAVLVFSFVGYTSKEFTVGQQTTLDVSLEETLAGIEEVIVVGYGVQRKSDVTGSITSVDIAKIGDVPSVNLIKALQGKAAGVEIQNTSTRPGGGTRIRIRGERSLSASNDPLIVVDGIPFGGSLNDINVDDIESIEILKDASATVIYGSRGSNGVILIQTRRGQEGDLRITYKSYLGVSTVAREYDVFNAEEFIKLRTAAKYTNYMPNERESMLLGRETDWQKLIYQNGITTDHVLGISGGTKTNQYAFSGGYFNETGILPYVGFTRYTLRGSIDQQIGKFVRIGFSTMNSYGITDGQSANPMWELVSLTPLSTAYNNDGTLNEQPVFDTDYSYNPITLSDESRWKEQNRRLASFNTFYTEVQLYKGLRYRLNAGVDLGQTKYNNFYGSNTPFRDGSENTARVQNSDNLGYTLENILTYDLEIRDAHRINFTGMYSVQRSTYTSSRFDALNVPVDYLQYHNLSMAGTVTVPGANNNYSQWSLMSYMGRLNYSYKGKYLATVTGRSDGSSRLAPGNKWHSYPAFALGWNVHRESFMENVNMLSNLKLRVGYGTTGNTAINPYTTLGGLTGTFYSFGDDGVKGYYVSSLPNKSLGWERTTTTNIGLDFGLFEQRISGSVDVYLQETEDLLLGKRLPASQGVSEPFLQNIGQTETRGLEVVLNGDIIRPEVQDGFSWDMTLTFFLNREKIVALQEGATEQIGDGWFVGQPISLIYDYTKTGIWQLGEEVEAAGFGAKPGDIKIKDISGPEGVSDGAITDADRSIIGVAQPDFQGGFTSTFNYKGIDLSIVGYARVGGMIISNLHMPNDYVNRLDGRRNGIKVDYWTPDNPTNDMPAPDVNIVTTRTSVLGYFDGSFLKIRSINLGYNIPKSITRIIGPTSTLRVYGSVVDPFIFFSPYVKAGGVDPEPNATGQPIAGSPTPTRMLVIGLNTPPVTKFIFGVNVQF